MLISKFKHVKSKTSDMGTTVPAKHQHVSAAVTILRGCFADFSTTVPLHHHRKKRLTRVFVFLPYSVNLKKSYTMSMDGQSESKKSSFEFLCGHVLANIPAD